MRWLNVRCLDAPLIAVAWQAMMADAFSVRVRAVARVVLFLTVWAIYLGDRYADVASLPQGISMSARQAYCRAHQRLWRWLVPMVLIGDALLVALFVKRAVLCVGAVVGAGCVLYLLANRFADRAWRHVPVKELTIGVLFAIGTVAPLIASPAVVRVDFPVGVFLLGCLISLNSIAIATWEQPLDALQGKHSIGTRSPHLQRRIPILAASLALLCALVAGLHLVPLILGLWIALTAIATGLIGHPRVMLAMDDRTALADLILLAVAAPAALGVSAWVLC